MCGILKELANLAVHGHHAGKNSARKSLDSWQSSLEGLGQGLILIAIYFEDNR